MRDTKVAQLVLLVGPKVRSWYVHCTMHRKSQRVRLGPWPIVGADEARDKALDALRRIYRGESARLERPKASPTLAEVLAEYLEGRELSRQGAADLRSIIGKHAGAWVSKPVDAMTAPAVAARYREIAKGKPAQAMRLLGALGALDRYAHAAHGVGAGNLGERVRALLGGVASLEARHTVITAGQFAGWWSALASESAPSRRYLLALALTGCRANELRQLPRDGWDAGVGVVSIATTKNGKPHAVPVGAYLRGLIDEEASASTGALFNVPVKVYRAAVDRIGAAIGLDWHLHDLRRTFATEATRAGVAEGVLKALMNHSVSGNVTAKHYVQRNIEDLRPPMQAIESRMLALWGVAPV